MAGKSGADARVFVVSIVVEDNVDAFAGWHRRLDGMEVADELAVAMKPHAAAEDRAGEDAEGGKQGRHAGAV